MIPKEKAQELNIKIIQSDDALMQNKEQKLQTLKELLPNIVNSDNQIDIKALNDFVDISHTTSNAQGYELTFAGKGLARAQADIPTTKELRAEEAQSKDFDSAQNIIIRGDNLDALKILIQNYFNKIKMTYIDPPYNTKTDSFIYKDDFRKNQKQLINELNINKDTIKFLANIYSTKSHSGWLSFIYPRLKLARELLKEDGVIFISIDDNEQANLKIICDEIFGEENFISIMPRKTVEHMRKNADYEMQNLNDFVLVYAKDINSVVFFKKIIGEKKYEHKDDFGDYTLKEFQNSGKDGNRYARPNLYYPIYLNPTDNSLSLTQNKGDIEILPKNDGRWLWSKETFSKKVHLLKYEKKTIYRKDYYDKSKDQNKYQAHKTWLEQFPNRAGTKAINDLGLKDCFSNPKPTDLIKHFLSLCTCDDDIILDFFAGSGTTGDALMQLNAQDGGERKFILIQIDEEIDANKNKAAYDFCIQNNLSPVISSITIERINKAGEKIKGEKIKANMQNEDMSKKDNLLCKDNKLDIDKMHCNIAYKVFSLTNKPQIIQDKNNLFQIENTRSDKINTLYNMLCATCKPISAKIQEIKKGTIYKACNEIYVLGNIAPKDTQKYKDLKINIDGYCDISLQSWLNLDIANKENITIIY